MGKTCATCVAQMARSDRRGFQAQFFQTNFKDQIRVRMILWASVAHKSKWPVQLVIKTDG